MHELIGYTLRNTILLRSKPSHFPSLVLFSLQGILDRFDDLQRKAHAQFMGYGEDLSWFSTGRAAYRVRSTHNVFDLLSSNPD